MNARKTATIRESKADSELGHFKSGQENKVQIMRSEVAQKRKTIKTETSNFLSNAGPRGHNSRGARKAITPSADHNGSDRRPAKTEIAAVLVSLASAMNRRVRSSLGAEAQQRYWTDNDVGLTLLAY
jgi:hypothetical protein